MQGQRLSITPVYVQRADHAQRLFHLLTLAQEKSALIGIYRGNPQRGTARPTTERMLKAFENINLLLIPVQETTRYYLTQLSVVQEHILALLGLPNSLYTDLAA